MKEIIENTGFFKELYTKFRSTISANDMNTFANLKTDVERWKYVKINHNIEFPIECNRKNTKNTIKALELKTKGNKCFQVGKNSEALACYSESLAVFPTDGDKTELSIIRANRSAALYHLEEYEVSMSDIKIAIALGYPKHLLHKVMDRKAKCLLGLKQHKKATKALQETISALDDAKIPVDECRKKQQDIQIMLKLMTKNKLYDEKIKSNRVTSHITGDKNPIYKAASKSVGFSYSEIEGRFAMAISNIPSGEVILCEPAHCAVLLQEKSKTHCFHCMRRVYFAEPCPNCTLVRFCSVQCQIAANMTHHKFECTILQTMWNSGASITCLMAVRIITNNCLSNFLKFEDDLLKGIKASDSEYNGEDYSVVYDLVNHNEMRSTEDMLHRSYMGLFLHECLQKSGYFQINDLSNEERARGEELTAALILRHLQALQFNAHEISEMVFHSENPESWKSSFLGGGLFPTLALFNHSCDPSIIRYFEGSKVIVRTIKNIKAGEPIFENYGPMFTQTPKKDRQNTLKSQYWFNCNCEPCTRNWPLIHHMDTSTMRFHCENAKCDNVVVVPVNTPSFMVPCNKCNNHTNILKGLKVLQDSESLFRLGQSFLQSGDIFRGLSKFLELQTLLSDTLVPPFKDFYLCQQNVRNCLMALGNTHPPLHKFAKN